MFEPTIVSDVVISTALGFAFAFAIYWWFSKSRGALRFIDLVSFAIGFLAICAGLFAVYHYRGDDAKTQHRWMFKLDVSEANLDTRIDMMASCERVPHSPYAVPAIRITECQMLTRYLSNLKVNDEFPIALYPPNVASYTDPIIKRLAMRVAESVASANEAIKAYNEDVQHQIKFEAWESIFRELALPVLAWAFGLGIGRRTIDLFLDLSDRSRQRLQKFSGYSFAQPLANRGLVSISKGLKKLFRHLRRVKRRLSPKTAG